MVVVVVEEVVERGAARSKWARACTELTAFDREKAVRRERFIYIVRRISAREE